MIANSITCGLRGCSAPRVARGMCSKHYQRWKRYGDPSVVHRRLPSPPLARFWSHVDRGEMDDCWLWTGATQRQGYGCVRIRLGVRQWLTTRAHRVAYEALVGPIPEGLELDHACHTRDRSCQGGVNCTHRRCCNPAHLEPVTHLENTRRKRRGNVDQITRKRDRMLDNGLMS